MSDTAFRDPDRPLVDRVADLLAQLTLDEKLGLLHQHQAAVPRLGLPPFRTGTEALHGVAWLGPATVFPQAVGLASTWNPALLTAVGSAVGDEVRAMKAGPNVWAPVVNPLRDPRWGRNEEGYSEDPWLTGALGAAYATGLRGDHPDYLKTAPTLKHFLGYNNETDRATTSSNLPPRVLHEYELPAFKTPIAAGAAVALMASYNLVNGRPAHLSPLINGEVRRWTPDELLVVGDAGGVGNLAGAQGYLPDHPCGYAAALLAGIDSFTEGDADPAPTVERLSEALRRGLLDESDVDTAVRHVLAVRFRLGDFDPAERNPYTLIDPSVVNCAAHRALARDAARQSIVLLKNQLLPLDPGTVKRIAVVGPLADAVHTDWYSGTQAYAITARAGIAARFEDVAFHEGVDRIALHAEGRPLGEYDVFDWGAGILAFRATASGRYLTVDDAGVLVDTSSGPGGWVVRETFRAVERDGAVLLHHLATDRFVTADPAGVLRANAAGPDAATGFTVEIMADGVLDAAALARDADVAVVVVGNHPMVNGRETEDRPDLALPAAQEALVRAVHAANPRTVLVLASGYPYAIGWAATHAPAIVWSAHGGQEYGAALAEVLTGDADPGGRLTQTWYRSAAELPDLLDYDVIDNDATYLYYRGEPLFPFGHGLSYTRFAYEGPRLSAGAIGAGDEVEVAVDVTNVGSRSGEEVVQLYTRQRRSRVKQPLRQLRAFARVRLAPGERTTVVLRLRGEDFAYWDEATGRPVVERARHTVLVGRSCTDILLTAVLDVHGPVPDGAYAGAAAGTERGGA